MSVEWKYYEVIKRARAHRTPKGPGATPEIDFDKPASGFFARVAQQVFNRVLGLALWFFRNFWPTPRFGRLVIVTRAEDACEALTHPSIRVPYTCEMIELGGANSILGLEGVKHERVRCLVARAFGTTTCRAGDTRDEATKAKEDREAAQAEANHVVEEAIPVIRALIANAQGRLDVIGDLITRCAAETCARYYGLTPDDPVAFADWTMAVSKVLFADPLGDEESRRRALYASSRLQQLAMRGIAEARLRRRKELRGEAEAGKTIIDRLIALNDGEKIKVSDEELCANLVGLVTAFVPTSPLAGGKILQFLLDHPKIMRTAHYAARAGNRAELKAIIWEAARLNPGLNPGQWRYVTRNGVIAKGKGFRRERKIRKNDVLLVATASALRDWHAFPAPLAFDPKRSQDPDLMFGFGAHDCLGKHLAMALLTEVFMQLLAQFDLRCVAGPTGKMRWGGPYPRQLDMEFTPPLGAARQPGQSMIAVCAPLSRNADLADVRQKVAALGNPVQPDFKDALDSTGRIHFLSLTLIDVGEDDEESWRLLLEVNADGPADEALSLLANAAGEWLKPIFDNAADGRGSLFYTLKRYNMAGHAKPWSMTHLNFNGVDEFSVAEIKRQRDLADFVRRAIDWYVRNHTSRGLPPMLVLRFVRRLISGLITYPVRREPPDEELYQLAQEGKAFREFVVQPSRRRLKLADWQQPSDLEVGLKIATSPEALPVWKTLGAVSFTIAALYFLGAAPWTWASRTAKYELFGLWTVELPKITADAGDIVATMILAGIAGIVGVVLLLGAAAAYLRYKEARDVPDTRFPTLAHLKARTKFEDAPGYAQNHFIATPTLKKGLFRRLILGFAFWGIFVTLVYAFRPGFVVSMGTIHYAKWFRAPASRRLVFLADYDGSWESYLEDFITKAHQGQSAGWSNCEGFPTTRFLIGEGAQDGDRFKRWVRLQQVPSVCWYSAVREVTTEQIRNHALIHHGIARARNDSEARAWLACFGTQQRPGSMLETEEIQSLAFTGFKDLPYGVCAVFRLPFVDSMRKAWLEALVGVLDPTTMRLTKPEDDMAVTFGDTPPWRADKRPSLATTVAFTGRGLFRLGLPTGGEGDGLATFPGAFQSGMSRRTRVFGDKPDPNQKPRAWGDAPDDAGTPVADGVLMIYGKTAQQCKDALAKHAKLVWIVEATRTQPAKGNTLGYEHFGFRDGLSQPLVRGTQRFLVTDSPEDIAEPGEFILGYRSNQGYFPTTPVVNAGTDGLNLLATAKAGDPSRFPGFAEDQAGLMFHDFGRNGSYLAIRKLEQHVDRFTDFTQQKAIELEDTYPGLSATVGAEVTADWVAAKLVGRWRDGTPLVDRPQPPKARPKDMPDNGFTFGVDDPQGVRCPLGAHIRRANPRDSLEPLDKEGRKIVNRHRILRRGRTYGAPGEERGLIFACLCTDIERQFEFVQQTWLDEPAFHGLKDEEDPLVGDGGGDYTIPTPAGPIKLHGLQRFVTPRAGGYFFMPSRAALAYLANLGL